jgi:hypothetical protein
MLVTREKVPHVTPKDGQRTQALFKGIVLFIVLNTSRINE